LFSLNFIILKLEVIAGCWWLTPVILATQEAEIRRIVVQSQPWVNSSQDPISEKKKKKSQKKGWWSGLSGKRESVRPCVQTPMMLKKKKKLEVMTVLP
jgi:hypothetical protein